MDLITKSFDGRFRWIRVVPSEANRLPSANEQKPTWIRLDLIEEVRRSVCFGGGDDPSTEYSIVVRTSTGQYHPSLNLFHRKDADLVIDQLLDIISEARMP
ncbi:hypothetical protein [Herbaspirillum camelliae]|uniref:hypothetical protein n=1 Tax=Herbaspirillum camelliae TaxID=1892903 RepID=UPI00117B605E|nr:hypothetical protein [Herbaspirillum camelliae]